MSRKQRRNKRATLERAANGMYGTMGIQGYGIGNRAGNNITIPASILAQMLTNMAPQKNQSQDFSPGSPLQPYSGIVPKFGPRQFSYPVGVNMTPPDRTLAGLFPNAAPFQQLRLLADTYDGVTLAERVILDMIPALVPKVRLKEQYAKQGIDENEQTEDITQWMSFVENPSPGQGLDIHSWLKMAWTESTQIDALAIYRHKNRGGGLFGLEIIAGDEIKPLLDERGMIPQPPFPAYQNYPYGVPGDEYTIEQMLYYRESPRAKSPYGFSRIERIITRINQAVHKEQKDDAYFTEGNQPFAFMEVPETSQWTPDQIDAYEQAWNALLAGNWQQQVRMKFLQPGMKYIPAEVYQLLTDFDKFILNVCMAAYGLSMGDVGFTEDIHKSSGDSQQNMMFRRTLAPFISVYSHILTQQCYKAFGNPYLEVVLGGYEEPEDIQTQAAAYSQFATVGAISPAGIARLMKFPDIPETGPLLISKTGVTPLKNYEEGSDFRKASDAAQLAGLQQAAQPPQPQVAPGASPSAASNNAPSADDLESSLKAVEKTTGTETGRASEPAILERVTAMLERMERLLAKDTQRSAKPEPAQQHNTGMMLAFLLDEATAQKLAIPDGEPASEMHITLAYLGDMEDPDASAVKDGMLRPHTSPFKIRDALARVASESMPMQGYVQGIGRFGAPDGEPTPVYAAPDVPGLAAFRTKIVRAIEGAGYFVAHDHDFTPHITLAYIDAADPMPVSSVPRIPLTLDTVSLVVGDNQYDFKLGDEQYPDYWDNKLIRYDPVHGAGGRFGTTGTAPAPTKGHHKGRKKKGRTVSKARLIARMEKLAARYTYLAKRKRTALQQNAATAIAQAFTQIAQGLSAGKDVSGAMNTVVSQSVVLHGGRQAAPVAAMETLFGTMQAALKAGIVRAMETNEDEEDEDDEDWLDVLEEELFDESERTQDEERTGGASADTGRGDREVAARQAGDGVIQPVPQRADLQSAVDSKLVAAEYKRWYFRAKDDVKAGKAQRGFTTTLIPEPVHEWIADELSRAMSIEDVKRIFNESREREASFFAPAAR